MAAELCIYIYSMEQLQNSIFALCLLPVDNDHKSGATPVPPYIFKDMCKNPSNSVRKTTIILRLERTFLTWSDQFLKLIDWLWQRPKSTGLLILKFLLNCAYYFKTELIRKVGQFDFISLLSLIWIESSLHIYYRISIICFNVLMDFLQTLPDYFISFARAVKFNLRKELPLFFMACLNRSIENMNFLHLFSYNSFIKDGVFTSRESFFSKVNK